MTGVSRLFRTGDALSRVTSRRGGRAGGDGIDGRAGRASESRDRLSRFRLGAFRAPAGQSRERATGTRRLGSSRPRPGASGAERV
jgi:hypothetical protein